MGHSLIASVINLTGMFLWNMLASAACITRIAASAQQLAGEAGAAHLADHHGLAQDHIAPVGPVGQIGLGNALDRPSMINCFGIVRLTVSWQANALLPILLRQVDAGDALFVVGQNGGCFC